MQLEVNTKNIPKEKHNNKKVFFIIKTILKIKLKKRKEGSCALDNKSTEPKAKKNQSIFQMIFMGVKGELVISRETWRSEVRAASLSSTAWTVIPGLGRGRQNHHLACHT